LWPFDQKRNAHNFSQVSPFFFAKWLPPPVIGIPHTDRNENATCFHFTLRQSAQRSIDRRWKSGKAGPKAKLIYRGFGAVLARFNFLRCGHTERMAKFLAILKVNHIMLGHQPSNSRQRHSKPFQMMVNICLACIPSENRSACRAPCIPPYTHLPINSFTSVLCAYSIYAKKFHLILVFLGKPGIDSRQISLSAWRVFR